MRKRCKRWVIQPGAPPVWLGSAPVADAELAALRVRELLALDALCKARGTAQDLRDLMVSAAVVHELARLGYGADQLLQLARADAALAACKSQPPGATRVHDAQREALRWLLTFADQQRTAATRADYVRALLRVQRNPSRYGIRRA